MQYAPNRDVEMLITGVEVGLDTKFISYDCIQRYRSVHDSGGSIGTTHWVQNSDVAA